MPLRSDYGRKLAELFHLEESPAFTASYLDKSEVMVTQIRCDHANNGLSDPIPPTDAFLVTTQVRSCKEYEVTVDGEPIANAPLSVGTTSIFDLRTRVQVLNISPFRNLHFLLPKSTMNFIAEDEGLVQFSDLNHDPGKTLDDSVIAGLANSLLPSFDRPEDSNTLFVDHITLALASYVANTIGSRRRHVTEPASPLSSLQERRTKELIDASPDGEIRLSSLASEVGLSVREFKVGFQKSTGKTPYAWLQARRAKNALGLIGKTKLSLEEIADKVGYQSKQHMEREIFGLTGVSPGTFREVQKH
jgi:AraC family transcriptional regulator